MNELAPKRLSRIIGLGFALAGICHVLLATQTAHAEQRALLVGVGKYQMPGNDLPGIDLDLVTMRETLNLLGFEDTQIMTLLDEEATSDNVIDALGTWLIDGVTPEDRVVFYYSGHGSFVIDEDGDEADGVDEVLVTHDVHRRKVNGQSTLGGVVHDDVIARLIARNPSRNVWTIVDACHSGTATRTFTMQNLRLGAEPMFSRALLYEGMPVGEGSIAEKTMARAFDANFVSISAASDTEQALGNAHGGIFTIGLSKAIRASAQATRNISVEALRASAAAYIEAHVDPRSLYHPQVTGSDRLANGALPVVPLEAGEGPNWIRLMAIAQALPERFAMRASNDTYRLGDAVLFDFEVPVAGYLNVVTVDSKDNAVVLFPNQFHTDNAVVPGSFRVPTEIMTFDLPATEPVGPTMVVGFVTRENINFYDAALDGRNAEGIIEAEFTPLSQAASRAMGQADGAYAATLEVTIVR